MTRPRDGNLAPAKRVRMEGGARRAQIVAATVRLVGQYGIEGTTVSRIADDVGVSDMALYRYFASKTDMLAAALEYLAGRAAGWTASSSHPWVPTRLREIGHAHFDMLTADIEMWNAPMMQYVISRSAQLEVSAVFVEGRLLEAGRTYLPQARELLNRHLQEGKGQGSIRPDADLVAFGWEWMSWAQGEDLHYLIAEGTDGFNREPHLRMLDLIIRDIELPQRE